MRVAPSEYYAIRGGSQEVATKVGALARERIGGLQSIAAESPEARVSMLGHRWDAACIELRRFLARNQISFEWSTPDAATRPATWSGSRMPSSRCSGWPTVRSSVGPTTRELAQLLRSPDESTLR
jgi:thioredoxin reductase (NADPH)